MVGTKLYSHLAVMMRALNYIFPVFFSFARPSFCGKKLRLGSTQQIQMILFSFFLSCWFEYTTYCANWSMIIFTWFLNTLCPKMPKNGHKGEESYEGHLRFKSEVSPLIFTFGRRKEIRKLRLSCVEPNLIARQTDWKNQRKKLLPRWWSLLKSPKWVRNIVFR